MTEPKTEAGRKLAEGWLPQDEVYQAVLAIEAEVRRATVDRIRDRIGNEAYSVDGAFLDYLVDFILDTEAA